MSNCEIVKKKRYRTPKAKPGQLLVRYGQEYGNKDIYYCHGGDGANKSDSKLLMIAFENIDICNGKNLRQELVDRGYDITTLKFSIMKTNDCGFVEIEK